MTGILRIKDAEGVWHDIQAIKGADGERGPVGPQGPKGADGTMKFEDLTTEQREMLRGPIGETGPQGPIGEPGPAGKDGQDYVLTEEDKTEIAGMVPGNDVKVDGTTIIQNEDGTISTAIGGCKFISNPGETKYSYQDATGFTRAGSGNSRYVIPSTAYTNVLESFISLNKLLVRLEYRNVAGETGFCEGYIIYSAPDAYWKATDLYVFDDKITSISFRRTQGTYFDGTKNASQVFENYYITLIKCYTEPTYDYEKIDGNYIKYGEGLTIDTEDGVSLKTTMAGAYVQDGSLVVNSYMSGLNNTITTGTTDSLLMGQRNKLNGSACAILGRNNTATGGKGAVILLGDSNQSTAYETMALGNSNTLSHIGSVATGIGLNTTRESQTLYGKYNQIDSTEYPIVIGNGTTNTSRRDAMTVDTNNQVHFPGTVVIGENKEEIATKAYVEELLANLPVGDIPSGEEVKF